MPEAPLEWKINILKAIRDRSTAAACDEGRTPRQDLIWIQDMERDGYISAKFRMGYRGESQDKVEWGVPNMIWEIHVLDKGRQLIAMDPKENSAESARNRPRKYWHDKPTGKIIVGVIIGVLVFVVCAWLEHRFAYFSHK